MSAGPLGNTKMHLLATRLVTAASENPAVQRPQPVGADVPEPAEKAALKEVTVHREQGDEASPETITTTGEGVDPRSRSPAARWTVWHLGRLQA